MTRHIPALFLALLLVGPAAAGTPPASSVYLAPADAFPDLEFYGLLAPTDYAKLGLDRSEGPVRLSEIPGDVLVVEFFNKSCVPCQRQVREVEAFYQELERRGLLGRIRLLAIAAGNNPKYLGRYRKRRKLTYPITADPQFDQWRRIGDPGRTPFTLFLVRRDGTWRLARYSFGVQWKQELLGHALTLLARPEEALASATGLPVDPTPLVLPLDAAGVRAKARALIRRAAGDPAADVAVVELGDGTSVYQAVSKGHRLPVFAKVASRRPVCEVCEAVHFLFAFDRGGRILGFEPIHVTKYGNEEWDERDWQFFEKRVTGRNMADLPFDPKVDAVSKATMSSALIFDEMRRTLPLLKKLPADGAGGGG